MSDRHALEMGGYNVLLADYCELVDRVAALEETFVLCGIPLVSQERVLAEAQAHLAAARLQIADQSREIARLSAQLAAVQPPLPEQGNGGCDCPPTDEADTLTETGLTYRQLCERLRVARNAESMSSDNGLHG